MADNEAIQAELDDVKAEKEPPFFSVQVTPGHMHAIPEQRCVFLVAVAGEEGTEEQTVNISATAPDSTVSVYPETVIPGQVAEVTVIPSQGSKDKNLTLTIRAQRGGLNRTEKTTIEVIGGNDNLGPTAAEIRDRFVSFLAGNLTELGITKETEWTGTIIRPGNLVVMFYLFFSEEWEMGMIWHTTMAPYDYARIYLRHRVTEVQPSHGFGIDSLFDKQQWPYIADLEPIWPPNSIWR